ncbi:MAG TPA: GNAT family N-acetyltransferase [Actinomycetes bacterium]|jgi:GNAT superfamily N-acetyltransferase|nr:GNAT family N-acetyltransferase [Actinomycetes bacterium]
MEIRVAVPDDVGHLAGMLGLFAERDEADGAGFAPDLLRWWSDHDSHLAFLAVLPSGEAVAMAWLAIAERVPRPGGAARLCGDVQSVFVVAEHRSAGVGTALLRAVVQHAESLGLEHVTVHSNPRANSLYERVGFTSSPELLMWTWR